MALSPEGHPGVSGGWKSPAKCPGLLPAWLCSQRVEPTWRLLPSSCWLQGFRPHLSCGHPFSSRPPPCWQGCSIFCLPPLPPPKPFRDMGLEASAPKEVIEEGGGSRDGVVSVSEHLTQLSHSGWGGVAFKTLLFICVIASMCVLSTFTHSGCARQSLDRQVIIPTSQMGKLRL